MVLGAICRNEIRSVVFRWVAFPVAVGARCQAEVGVRCPIVEWECHCHIAGWVCRCQCVTDFEADRLYLSDVGRCRPEAVILCHDDDGSRCRGKAQCLRVDMTFELESEFVGRHLGCHAN